MAIKTHKTGTWADSIYKSAGLLQRDVYLRAGVSESTFRTYRKCPWELKITTIIKIERVLREIKEENK